MRSRSVWRAGDATFFLSAHQSCFRFRFFFATQTRAQTQLDGQIVGLNETDAVEYQQRVRRLLDSLKAGSNEDHFGLFFEFFFKYYGNNTGVSESQEFENVRLAFLNHCQFDVQASGEQRQAGVVVN